MVLCESNAGDGSRVRRASTRWAAAGLVALVASWIAAPAVAATDGPACSAPKEFVRLNHPLPHVAARLATGAPLKIVALGSSSTFGHGATTPEGSYPSRLQALLRRAHPGQAIEVINRGVNGNETREMLLRFEHDVLAEKPDLVIWQIGTNTLLNDHAMWPVFLDVRAGIRRLRAQGSDVLLLNPQYSPRVLAKPNYEAMNDLVEVTAREMDVDMIDRFAVMRYWSQSLRYPFDVFITPDGLHMNDWAYACLAEVVANTLKQAGPGEMARH